MNKLLALIAVVVVVAAIIVGFSKWGNVWPFEEEWVKHPVTLAVPSRGVALVVQNHVPGGTPVPMAAFASTLTANLSGGELRVINVDNVIGVSQNKTIEGEISPEASATSIGQMLNAGGVLTASVVEFTSTSLGVPSPHSYKLRVRVELSLADSGSGEVVCSVDGEKEDVFTKEQMDADGSARYERLLLDASAECAQKFLGELQKIGWLPQAPDMATVKFVCNVAGASVKLDGVLVGTSPVCVIAPRGIHNLRVEHQFYTSYSSKVNLVDGQRLEIQLNLNEEGMKRFGKRSEDASKSPEQNADSSGLKVVSAQESPTPSVSWWDRLVEKIKETWESLWS